MIRMSLEDLKHLPLMHAESQSSSAWYLARGTYVRMVHPVGIGSDARASSSRDSLVLFATNVRIAPHSSQAPL